MAKIKKDTSLRKAILQAAITGQLISNVDGEAETGKQLLDRIIEERNKKLLAEWEEKLKENPKVKKPVPIVASEIDDEDIPFEIPESWCWCRLGEICNEIKRGKSPKYAEKSDYLAFAQKCNAKTGEIDLGLALYLDEKTIGRYSEEDNLIQGDIVINSTGGGTMGRVGYYETKLPSGIKGVYPDSHVTVIRSIGNLNQKYLYYFLKLNQPILEKCGTGSTNQTELKPAVLSNFLFPLPPLAVQNAIVAKIEEVLPLVDAYENVVLQKEELKNALPDKVKKAILQEAIQGKLTEDWRIEMLKQVQHDGCTEETGKQLLDRIIEERNAKLLAEWEEAKKKNPKAKKPTLIVASEIDEEDIPFEVPDSWCWCRLGDVGITNTGTTPSKNNPEYFGKHIDFLSPGDIQDSKITYGNQGLSESGYKVARPTPPGTIIQVCIGGSIGKCAIVDREVTFNQQINSITVIKCSTQYVCSVLSSDYFHCIIRENSTGTATPIINKSSWEKLLFPLPPLAEQEKIVEIIEQMLPLCENLGR